MAVEDIWHDNNGCPIACSIAAQDRVTRRTQFFKHCPICAAMNAPLPRPAPPVKLPHETCE